MKSVLISIHPKWCEMIASGKKTVEVRKTRPKIETPFKCYIYCTKAKEHFSIGGGVYATSDTLYRLPTGEIKLGDGFELMGDWRGQYDESNFLNGKVIGEFVCDDIKTYYADDFVGAVDLDGTDITEPKDGVFAYWIPEEKETCLPYEEILAYGNGKTLYGWHISDLKIYDKPRELSEFNRCCPDNVHSCATCRAGGYTGMRCTQITMPPQSWFYVKENESSRCGDSLKTMKEWENEK